MQTYSSKVTVRNSSSKLRRSAGRRVVTNAMSQCDQFGGGSRCDIVALMVYRGG